ncbi:hypothetical protein RUM44_004877 [Polyplax serrata]|uniref:Uncharacterized protein n=1 Tax=Polyplax serrata TaxID=468196 RepID=A0ABR1B427_POLSC
MEAEEERWWSGHMSKPPSKALNKHQVLGRTIGKQFNKTKVHRVVELQNNKVNETRLCPLKTQVRDETHANPRCTKHSRMRELAPVETTTKQKTKWPNFVEFNPPTCSMQSSGFSQADRAYTLDGSNSSIQANDKKTVRLEESP